MSGVKSDKRYLLVVTILNGRSFPHRLNESLQIDVKFDGQVLSSLPVSMVEEPAFETDMAFRLTGKQLKDHKIKKTPIKIEVLKVNKKTKKPDKVGYQTLDLRTHAIEVGRPRFTWLPLLGSQAFRAKPEIHVGVSVDDDPDVENMPATPKEFTRSARVKEYTKLHQPILVNDVGGSYYQLGPSKDSTDIFQLTVTIGYASNLERLFDNLSPTSRPRQFFFHYELMTNHLTSKTFDDYESADFAPERVSIRIKSHLGLLKEYFLHHKALKVRLCQGSSHIVATAEMPYAPLFPTEFSDLSSPVLVEKEIPVHPVTDSGYSSSRDDPPVMGIAIELSTAQPVEDIDFARTLTLGSSQPFLPEILANSNNGRPKTAKPSAMSMTLPSRSKSTASLNSKDDYENLSDITDRQRSGRRPPDVVASEGQFPRYAPAPLSLSRRSSSGSGDDEGITEPQRKRPAVNGSLHQEKVRQLSAGTQVSPSSSRRRWNQQAESRLDLKSSQTTQTGFGDTGELQLDSRLMTDSTTTNRFTCVVTLYKIKIVSTNIRTPQTIFIRYQYPFFGSAAPVILRPATEVQPRSETILHNNTTSFTFGCTSEQLVQAFKATPICIEVWRSGGSTHDDDLLGQGRLRLDLLYRSEVLSMTEQGKSFLRRVHDSTIDVIDLQSPSGQYSKLAELTVCVTLDDHGEISYLSKTSDLPATESVSVVSTATSVNGCPVKSLPKSDLRSETRSVEKLEDGAVFELEVWKDKEEKKFRVQLKMKEQELLRNISDEWERKKREQEDFLKESIRTSKNLESELRKLIAENEQQKVTFADREKRLGEADRYIRAEKAKLTSEMQDMEQKVLQDFTRRLELERAAQSLLKTEVKKLNEQVEDLQKRLAERDREVGRMRNEEKDKPFHQREMQAEIDRLTLEKNDLERRMVHLENGQQRYKEEWSKAQKEAAKWKDRLDAEQEKRMQEKDKELSEVRQQLDRLRPVQQEPQHSPRDSSPRDSVPKGRQKKEQNGYATQPPAKQRLAMRFNGSGRGPAGDSDGNDIIEEENEDISLSTDKNGVSADERSETDISEDGSGDEGNPKKQLIRCMDERNVLLKTGIYRQRDEVILELNKKISRLQTLIRTQY